VTSKPYNGWSSYETWLVSLTSDSAALSRSAHSVEQMRALVIIHPASGAVGNASGNKIMRKSKHTPGPWMVKRGPAGELAPYIICTFGSSSGEDWNIVSESPVDGNEQSDANLIAAAPRMLQALREISRKIKRVNHHDLLTDLSELHKAARTAIRNL
jgi:hypothetical protein